MLKSIIFLSVFISLATAAPYGYSSHSGSSDGMGISLVGSGSMKHGITERVVPLGSSHWEVIVAFAIHFSCTCLTYAKSF